MTQTPRRLRDWREVIDLDFPKVEVTARTVARAVEYKGQVRKPYEPAEYEARRQRILSQELPE